MRSMPRLVKWALLLAVFFLVLMSLARLVTWGYFNRQEVSWIKTIPVFWLGFRYDARVVGAVILIMLLVGGLSSLHPFLSSRGRKLWMGYFRFVAVSFIIFYVFDFLYFRYLSARLNASALNFLEDTKISAGMVWQTYPVVRIILGIIASSYLFNLVIRVLYRWAERRPGHVKKLNRNSWYAAGVLLCAFAVYGRPGQFPLRWSDAFNLGNDFEANIAFNPVQSFLSSLSFRGSTYDRATLQRSYPMMAAYLEVADPDSVNFNFRRMIQKRPGTDTARPNIVIVICESFSAYKSSMWGNPLNTTPYFASLSREGVFFDNCFTPHYGTARGVWATVTGIPDVELAKTASRNPAMVDQHTIINDFKGYEKFYFLGGSTSWANIRGLLTNNISNLHIYEEGKYDVPRIDVWGISDKNLFLEANKVLRRQQQPFFAIIQTADNHRPYTIPEEDLKAFNRVSLPLDTLHKYGFESNDELNAFRYTDFGYRTFVETARKEAYFKNTIFAFIGDHGIGGNAGAMFPKAWTSNGLDSYHVPLLFYSPGRLHPQRLHNVISQVDMLPTLAGIANIPYTNTTMGTDLLHQDTGSSANAMSFIMDHGNDAIGIVKGDYFYTRQPGGTKEELLWANFLKPDPGVNNDSLKRAYRELTSAYFETARYMLLNNKKLK